MKRIALMLASLSLLVASACSMGQKPTTKPAIDQKKFEVLYRSAKTMQGASTAGISYPRFMELLQEMATEVAASKRRATSSAEMELLALYQNALGAYKYSQTLWVEKRKLQIPDADANDAIVAAWNRAGDMVEKASRLYDSQGPVQK